MYRSTVISSPRSNSTFRWVTFPASTYQHHIDMNQFRVAPSLDLICFLTVPGSGNAESTAVGGVITRQLKTHQPDHLGVKDQQHTLLRQKEEHARILQVFHRHP